MPGMLTQVSQSVHTYTHGTDLLKNILNTVRSTLGSCTDRLAGSHKLSITVIFVAQKGMIIHYK